PPTALSSLSLHDALPILAFTLLGQEFIPTLDERNLAMASQRVPSTAVEQSIRMQRDVEAAIMKLPEVEVMFSKTGTAEVATDPIDRKSTRLNSSHVKSSY